MKEPALEGIKSGTRAVLRTMRTVRGSKMVRGGSLECEAFGRRRMEESAEEVCDTADGLEKTPDARRSRLVIPLRSDDEEGSVEATLVQESAPTDVTPVRPLVDSSSVP